ncbi:MAG: 5-(carboxyamino)imidazole ribonucleotide mutase [Peptoniphilus sp.]|nr:5-(carboxyamino)imidazole ribonucleotide mutase [Peptoniphilus sp.]MDD7362933.1 5-(carboxyamino)imidazole ribonucleotide mutase [Bacillota bacterium]MDY6044173.1 5-(carboxyamino)imidazole ribonucleotide mutase [Peptoniphilus sp.]
MKVSIIMGSYSDKDIAFDVIESLKIFDIAYDVVVYSAHRTPNEVVNYVKEQEEKGTEVFISIAGKAAHLGGVIAAHTTRPVIGVPGKTSLAGGMDSLLSTVQMPTGVPVATVAVNGGKNAGILAAQILSVGDDDLKEKLSDYKLKLKSDVDEMNRKLKEDLGA